MVKKLFKHEFLAWFRILPIIYGIVLIAATAHRILQLFESDTIYYDILFGSATFAFVVGLLVCLAAPTVFGITRFYRNLFTGEGYLSFTLPVTAADHLWVKVLTSVTFTVVSVLVCLMAALIIGSGEVVRELFSNIRYLIGAIPQVDRGHLAWYVVEYIILLLTACLSSNLMYCACICIGQLSNKNRALAAVGVYFGFQLVGQILGSVASIGILVLEESGVMAAISALTADDLVAAAHLSNWGSIVATALMATVYYLICHYIMRKRLNLE